MFTPSRRWGSRVRRATAALQIGALVSLCSETARADDAPAPAAARAAAAGAAPPVTPPPARVANDPELAWKEKWGRAQLMDHVAALAFGAGTLAMLQIAPRDRGWRYNAFDEGARDLLRVESRSARDRIRAVSDTMFYGLMAYPFLVDNMLVVGSQNSDTAWQLFVLNAESLAVSGFIAVGLQRTSGRARPLVRECKRDVNYDEMCTDGPVELYQSFLSGHVQMSFTGAGLICAHHLRLPIYGHPVADAAACALGVTAASAEAFTRIAVDRHYASDVIAGGIVGAAIGFGLPTLIRYGHDHRGGPARERRRSRASVGATVMPLPEGAALVATGMM